MGKLIIFPEKIKKGSESEEIEFNREVFWKIGNKYLKESDPDNLSNIDSIFIDMFIEGIKSEEFRDDIFEFIEAAPNLALNIIYTDSCYRETMNDVKSRIIDHLITLLMMACAKGHVTKFHGLNFPENHFIMTEDEFTKLRENVYKKVVDDVLSKEE